MKEAVFILAIVAALLVLTAVRYRKQIATAIGIYREFRRMRSQLTAKKKTPAHEQKPETLVCCQKCRRWVPESGAIRFGKSVFYCSQDCLRNAAVTGGAV